MRPHSIIMFERLFLASLVLSLASFLLSYEALMATVSNDLAMIGAGPWFMLALVGVSYAVYLLLWYLIARRAANWAKWAVVILVAIGLASLPPALMAPWDVTTLLGLLVYALEVAAVVYLFQADAKAWLSGKQAADPTTFD